MTHISDGIQARRVAAYRAAVETLPEDKQHVLKYWRENLAMAFCDTDKRLNVGDARVRAEAVIADILWRSG